MKAMPCWQHCSTAEHAPMRQQHPLQQVATSPLPRLHLGTGQAGGAQPSRGPAGPLAAEVQLPGTPLPVALHSTAFFSICILSSF